MMIPLSREEIVSLMEEWEEAKQKMLAHNFEDSSEDELVYTMLFIFHELRAQGYRRMGEQWVHLSELN
jgi:hypothetical protein